MLTPTTTTRSRWLPTEGSTVRESGGDPGRADQDDDEGAEWRQGDHREGEQDAQAAPPPRADAQVDQDRDLGQGGVEEPGEGLCRRRQGGDSGDQAEHPQGDVLDTERALHGNRFVVPAERGDRCTECRRRRGAELVEVVGPVGEPGHQHGRARHDGFGVGLEERGA